MKCLKGESPEDSRVDPCADPVELDNINRGVGEYAQPVSSNDKDVEVNQWFRIYGPAGSLIPNRVSLKSNGILILRRQ